VTSALSEIAESAKVGIRLDERSLPISEEVKGACEILGLDPLYVANEGSCSRLFRRAMRHAFSLPCAGNRSLQTTYEQAAFK
jgi:hydrogenase maturation factor